MPLFRTRYEIDKYIKIFTEEKSFQKELEKNTITLSSSKYYDLVILLLNNKDYITNNTIEIMASEDPPFLRDEICEILEKDFIKRDLYSSILYTFKYSTIKKFFRENWNRFTPDFDVLNITKTDQLRVFQESLMTEFDRLADTIDEIYNIQDIDKVPSQYLDYVGQLIGYEREERELLVDASFRELIKNIIEIYRIKGSNFSFELFFGFLGFDVRIDELWFDKRYYDSGVGTNPYTLITDKSNFNFYLGINKPTENIPEGMENPYTVREEDLVETLGFLEFEHYLNTGQYTLPQLLGEAPGYNGTPYTFFKTNIVEFGLTRLSSFQSEDEISLQLEEGLEETEEEEGGGLDERELRIIRLYTNFLIPIFISRRVSIVIFPYFDDANSLIVNHKLFIHKAMILIKGFYEDTYEKIYNPNNPDSIYSQILNENPEWDQESILKEISTRLSEEELFGQYPSFFLNDRDLMHPIIDTKISYPFVGLSYFDDFEEGTFPVFSKDSERFLKTFNENYNKFSYVQEPFEFPINYRKAKISTITEEITSGPSDEIGKGQITFLDPTESFNICNNENIDIQKKLIGSFEKGSNVIRNIEYSVSEAPEWQPSTFYEVGTLIRFPNSNQDGTDLVYECIIEHTSAISFGAGEASNFKRKYGINLLRKDDLIYFPDEMLEYKIIRIVFLGENTKEVWLDTNSPITENNKDFHTFRNFNNFIEINHAPSFKNEGVFNVIKSESFLVNDTKFTRLVTREPMGENQVSIGGFVSFYKQGRRKRDKIPFLFNVLAIIPDLKAIIKDQLEQFKQYSRKYVNIFTLEAFNELQEESLKFSKILKTTIIEFLNNIQDESITEQLFVGFNENIGTLKHFTNVISNDAEIFTFEALTDLQEERLKLTKVFKRTVIEFLNNIQDEGIMEYFDLIFEEELESFDDLEIKRSFSSFGENQKNILGFYESDRGLAGNKLTTVDINGVVYPGVSESLSYAFDDYKSYLLNTYEEDSLNLENTFDTPEEEYEIAEHYVTEDGWTRSLGYSYDAKLTLDFLYNHLDYKAFSHFMFKIKTDNIGFSEDNQYTLHVGDGIFNYRIEWGDGSNDYFSTSDNQVHTYAVTGEYIIKISGEFPHMQHPVTGGDPAKLIDVISWGSIEWGSMHAMFYNCVNITTFSANNVPDLSNVTDMSYMFYNAINFDGDIEDWDTSNVTNMEGVFGSDG